MKSNTSVRVLAAAGMFTLTVAGTAFTPAHADTGGSSVTNQGVSPNRAAGQAKLAASPRVAPTYAGYQTKPVTSPKGGSHSIWFGRMNYAGLLVYCIDGENLAPSQAPSKPVTRTQQVKLSYLLSRYANSSDKPTIGALSYISRQLLDPGWSFEQKAFGTLSTTDQTAIKARVAQLNTEAADYAGGYKPVVTNAAGTPSTAGTVRTGTATVGITSATGKFVPGVAFRATATGATFTSGICTLKTGKSSSTTTNGTTSTAATKLPWTATPTAKNGDKVTLTGSFTGIPASTYYEYAGPHVGEQRVIGAAPAGTGAGTGTPVTIKVAAPKAITRVSTQQWVPGKTITDTVITSGLESQKVDITAAAAVMRRPDGVASCENVGVEQWEKAFHSSKVSTISTAKVTGVVANTDVQIPLHLTSKLPSDVTAGKWCGSINENVWQAGTQKRLVATQFGEVNEWGSLTVAAPKPTPTPTPPSTKPTPPSTKPTPPSSQPVIPTDGLVSFGGPDMAGLLVGAGFLGVGGTTAGVLARRAMRGRNNRH